MANSISWYWGRLQCMTASEVVYRLRQTALIQFQKLGVLTAKNVPNPKAHFNPNSYVEGTNSVDNGRYLYAADQLLEGHLSVFSLHDYKQDLSTGWNRDPLTGMRAPLLFGKTLNYRNEALVGDIKYLWEPNRHLHLVTLAQAFYLTEESKYIKYLGIQLDSWVEQCPYLKGPNWTSSLELAIRLINWSIVWQLTGGAESPLFEGHAGRDRLKRLKTSVYQHAHFINGHFSRYSSGNNHLIGEAAGLFIATITWPYWDKFVLWRNTAKGILEEQAQIQNTPDGVNKEQAISYQQFVLDFLILAGLAGKENASNFSDRYWQRVEAMLEYLASIMDVAGNIPMIGDADDGYVVRMSQEDNWCPYKSLLATGAVLFGRGDFKVKAGVVDDKTRWIFGDEVASTYGSIESHAAKLPVRQSFVEGGYYVLGCSMETTNEIRVVVDAGPIGYEGIAAHGHADALAFTLNVSGREFLIDPGTYAYHTQKKWREYFRGTSAHNTLRIDNENQSVSGGNFMWLRKAEAQCELFEIDEAVDRFIGSHDGYCRLADPVTHRRKIALSKAERKIVVEDMLLCEGEHNIEGFWHFSESCSVELTADGIEVVNDGKVVVISYAGRDTTYEIVIGDEDRPAGWVSRQFDIKRHTSTVIWRSKIRGNTTFKTEICCT